MVWVKQLINNVAPRLLGMVKGVKGETPQARLVERVWTRLEDVLEKCSQTGTLDDNNFITLVNSVKEALIFLCENDKFYKRWLGLLAYFFAEEYQKMRSQFDYEEALNMTTRPMLLTKEEFERHKEALFMLHLTGYLHAMSLSDANIKEARQNNQYIDFETLDPNVIVRMVFPEGKGAYFLMMFKERVTHGNIQNEEV